MVCTPVCAEEWQLIRGCQVYVVMPFILDHATGGRLNEMQTGKEVSRYYGYHLETTKCFWKKATLDRWLRKIRRFDRLKTKKELEGLEGL